MSFENLSSSTKRRSLFGSRKKNKEQEDESFSIWGSLQELRQSDVLKQPQHPTFLEGTFSEPSLNQKADEVSFYAFPGYISAISLGTCTFLVEYDQLVYGSHATDVSIWYSISVQHQCRGAEKVKT